MWTWTDFGRPRRPADFRTTTLFLLFSFSPRRFLFALGHCHWPPASRPEPLSTIAGRHGPSACAMPVPWPIIRPTDNCNTRRPPSPTFQSTHPPRTHPRPDTDSLRCFQGDRNGTADNNREGMPRWFQGFPCTVTDSRGTITLGPLLPLAPLRGASTRRRGV